MLATFHAWYSMILRFAPLRRFLGRLAPASSARGSASALRDGDPGAAVLCTFHRTYHPSCSHLHRAVRRRPHSCTTFAVAARHFSRFPFARRLRFRCCPDSVYDTLTGQRVVAAQVSGSRVACGIGAAAARGGAREVARARRAERLMRRSRYCRATRH